MKTTVTFFVLSADLELHGSQPTSTSIIIALKVSVTGSRTVVYFKTDKIIGMFWRPRRAQREKQRTTQESLPNCASCIAC